MTQDEVALGIVIPRPEPAFRHEPSASMACGAKLGWVVTVTARGFPRIGGRRMSAREAYWMIACRASRCTWPMAVEAIRAYVTGGTRLGCCGGPAAVTIAKPGGQMGGRRRPDNERTTATIRPRLIHRADTWRWGQVTLDAALLRMTRTTLGRILPDDSPMSSEKGVVRMIGWCL